MLYTEILNKNKDFLLLYKKGTVIFLRHMVIYVRPNKLNYSRLGITAGKKVGNAVKRNRAKRIIREVYRANEINLPVGIDLVIVAKASICSVKSNEIDELFRKKAAAKINSAFTGEKEK